MTRTGCILLVLTTLLSLSQVWAAPNKDGKPEGGTLRYGEYGRPATLDPVTSNDMIALRISELLFNGLVGIDEKQDIVPELAKKWEISRDGSTYTFYLRQDVLWHRAPEGKSRAFTAADVVFTWNVMMHPKTITPLKVRYEFIDKVTRIDDYTVQFTLKRPVLNALAKFSFKIIPEFGPDKGDYLRRDDPFVRRPIGTGPYRFKEARANGDIVLIANEDYFRGRPNIDSFVVKSFADQNIMNEALMFNSIDMTVLVNPRNIAQIQGDRRIILKPYNALSYSFFGYNIRNPLLADKRVRKAFTMAINRREMLDSFFNSRGTVISGPFAPGSWAYNLDVRPLPYDEAGARKLLGEAGFSPGKDGIMRKNGRKLSLSLKVPIAKESEATKRVVLAFRNYLKRIGAEVKVEFQEWQAWKDSVFSEHDFDIMFASWVFDDSADISSLFHSAEIGAWKNNFGAYSNQQVDGLIAEAKLSLDHEKKRTIYRKLHAILAEESPYTFLWTLTNYAGYNKKIRRVRIHPYKFFTFSDGWYIPLKDQK